MLLYMSSVVWTGNIGCEASFFTTLFVDWNKTLVTKDQNVTCGFIRYWNPIGGHFGFAVGLEV